MELKLDSMIFNIRRQVAGMERKGMMRKLPLIVGNPRDHRFSDLKRLHFGRNYDIRCDVFFA